MPATFRQGSCWKRSSSVVKGPTTFSTNEPKPMEKLVDRPTIDPAVDRDMNNNLSTLADLTHDPVQQRSGLRVQGSGVSGTFKGQVRPGIRIGLLRVN